MAHRSNKGKTGAADVDNSRRAALTRLGLGISVACVAPVLLSPGVAQAGVVVGDGDVNGDGGGDGSGSSQNGNDSAPGHHIGANRRRKPEGGGERMTLQELLDYLANFAKANK